MMLCQYQHPVLSVEFPVATPTMLFYLTIGSTYFVKTQTYVALFGPRDLSQFFSNGMYIEVSPL